jgi:signal transduction histidine kinase
VFETILKNALRICDAKLGFLLSYDGNAFHTMALLGAAAAYAEYAQRGPLHPGPETALARVVSTRRVVQIEDAKAGRGYAKRDPLVVTAVEEGGARTMLAVPLLRENKLIGALVLCRQELRLFNDKQIALVTGFADQAVIAIENTRLFEEVQARNRDLTALGEVGRAINSTLDLKLVLKTVVERAVSLSGTDAGSIFYYRPQAGRFELGETTGLDGEVVEKFRRLDITTGQTGLGEAIASRMPLQAPDVTRRMSNPLRDAALEAGLRAALIVPLLGSEGALGALVLQRRHPGEFRPSVVSLMQSFADQSAIALENARLFEEIAQKSRELEIAGQHKSRFVANMSHELRTPIAAMLGYAELLQEGFYEPQGPKSMDALTRIRSNGKHLLGLINTVLDIAKIESGQFTLNMAEYAIESVVETVRSATESLAQNKKLALKTDVAKSLPIGLGDEQRLTQVLLNLVGNAIKFTDAGEVRVTAKAVNGHFAVSVADTGPGIPEHERSRIFEQFHQIDSSNTKAKGGTGLGLAIARQIVEMHGGRIWVESALGKGSTFLMELPARAEFREIAP